MNFQYTGGGIRFQFMYLGQLPGVISISLMGQGNQQINSFVLVLTINSSTLRRLKIAFVSGELVMCVIGYLFIDPRVPARPIRPIRFTLL